MSRSSNPTVRFWQKVSKSEGCWLWNGYRDKNGYGTFSLTKTKPVRAHRHSYALMVGPIPEGLVVMHRCDNPACVNPSHLSLGTQRDNVHDCMSKGRLGRVGGTPVKGEANHFARLSANEVRDILRLSNEGVNQPTLAKIYGVSQSAISLIVMRKTWRHI